MQSCRDVTLFLRRLVFLAVLPFFITVCAGGELSESESFFSFIRAIDPQNVLNISKMGSAPHPREWLNVEDTIQSSSVPPRYSQSGTSKKLWYKDFRSLIPLVLGLGLLSILIYFVGKKAAQLAAMSKELKTHGEPSIKKTITEVKEEGKLKKRESELVFFVEEHERFTLEDLLQATADLRNESFCSSLYKVILKNNMHYAVKRFKNLQVSSDEFGEQIRQISNLEHPNILPLVGYRSTNEEKLLIYKYQSNGSLLSLLKDSIEGKKDFPWKLRLSIACGISRGLGFIFQKLDGREIIPHGNLKLSNILLNNNNEPLISEHGLSKFLDPSRAFLFSSHGYTAPEKSLTEKGDVYSFGVILLELLTGKSVEINSIDLPRWVRSMVREEWTGEVFDKKIRDAEYQWAFPVLNIAILCISRLPENRPTMEEIMEKLNEVMHEHEQLEDFSSTYGNHGCNNEDCCSLHKIIPETWDSPGSNY